MTVLAACSGSDSDVSADESETLTTAPPASDPGPPVTVIAPATTGAATTAGPTTAPLATTVTTAAPVTVPTDAPTTAPPATTAATATTAAPVAPGWTPNDFDPGTYELGYDGNWEGNASPPVPADAAAPPADGYYHAELLAPWTATDPGVLHVRVQRFEQCPVLPAGVCDQLGDDDISQELGLDPSWSLDVDVPLDTTTSVVVGGWRCNEPDAQKAGSGHELGELLAAFGAAYDTAIAPLVASGVNDFDIAATFGAAPVLGFSSTESVCGPDSAGGGVLFEHGDAPTLLLQVLSRYVDGGPSQPLTPTELVQIKGVRITGGVPTWYFYAGFYS